MTRVEVDRPDARTDFEFLALNPDCGSTVLKDAAQRSLRLKADEKDGRLVSPEPVLQAMPNATGFAHSTGGDHDMKLPQTIERLALLNRFGEVDISGIKAADKVFALVEVCRMMGKDAASLGGKGRVDIDRDDRERTFVHQLDEIADQLLGSLDRE